MKDRLGRAVVAFVCLIIVCFPVGAASAQSLGNALQVRQTLGELRQWLASSGYGESWNAYLGNDALAAELDRASDPTSSVNVAVLQGVLSRYSSGSDGLQRRRFVAVREALTAWLDELGKPGVNELPAMVRDAANGFAPPDAAALEASKEQLARSSRQLVRYFGTGNVGAAWRRYLHWDQLQTQLAAPLPNVEALLASADQFESGYVGLEIPMFAGTARALRHYTQLNLVAQDPNAAAAYQQHMNGLADAIATFAASSDAESLTAVSGHINWLEARGLAPEITGMVRERLWRPNLIVHLAPDFAVSGLSEDINEISDITDVIMGTSIRGRAQTVGRINTRLLPADGRAVFENVFTGTTYSNTLGYNRGITINSYGETKFTAIKQFSFDALGFTGYGTNAEATTYSRTRGINIGDKGPLIRGLVQRVAERKVNESRPEADYVAARHAEDRIEEQMDRTAAERIAEANQQYYEKFRKPLLDRGLFPQSFDVHSSPAGLLFVARQYANGGVAATTPPPDLATSESVMISAHESAFNNMMTAMLAGRTIDRDEFLQELADLLGELPEDLEPPEDEGNWTMSFADEDPVTMSVTPGKVELIMRVNEIQGTRNSIDEEMKIIVTYRFEEKPGGFAPGDVIAVREGTVEAYPPDYVVGSGIRLPTSFTAHRGIVRSRFGEVFKEQVVAESRALPDRWQKAGDMWLRNVKTTRGWLVFGWHAQPVPESDVPTGAIVQ